MGDGAHDGDAVSGVGRDESGIDAVLGSDRLEVGRISRLEAPGAGEDERTGAEFLAHGGLLVVEGRRCRGTALDTEVLISKLLLFLPHRRLSEIEPKTGFQGLLPLRRSTMRRRHRPRPLRSQRLRRRVHYAATT